MAEVLPPQIQHIPPSLRRSNPSQPSLYIQTQTSPTTQLRKHELRKKNNGKISRSLSSPSRLNEAGNTLINTSNRTPLSPQPKRENKPIRKDTSSEVDSPLDVFFPGHPGFPLKIDDEGNDAPPSSPLSPSTPEQQHEPINVLHNRSHVLLKAEDDMAAKQEPSRHVDYLSYEWREEEIWSSWRHIVSQRKIFGEKSRLENASWRTWAKQKNRLRTVPPQTLNW
jgi:uncharacterized protein DUF1752